MMNCVQIDWERMFMSIRHICLRMDIIIVKITVCSTKTFLWKIPQTSLDSNPALEQNPDNVSDPKYPL